MKQGTGPVLKAGDVAYIQFSVLRINGDYMFSLGKETTLNKDTTEQYRMVYGAKQVPEGVERGMNGMREGGERRIVVPSEMGWGTSNGLPMPDNFSGKRKLELYRNQPLMMDVELQRIIPSKTKLD
eukprot:CAMPEP_0171453914 /NCGR_PEP_ID=MMETSP0945-20130129/1420_1 /TAXON_ID=109269 /ORGANISM="Vaucheria litorea, Strain CCMP2940" /LENGTH=125 /DNA_ID=CAMNT_0011978853 /DNA_START=341 /DNA_END=718 /DNA_ORIENTATION=+